MGWAVSLGAPWTSASVGSVSGLPTVLSQEFYHVFPGLEKPSTDNSHSQVRKEAWSLTFQGIDFLLIHIPQFPFPASPGWFRISGEKASRLLMKSGHGSNLSRQVRDSMWGRQFILVVSHILLLGTLFSHTFRDIWGLPLPSPSGTLRCKLASFWNSQTTHLDFSFVNSTKGSSTCLWTLRLLKFSCCRYVSSSLWPCGDELRCALEVFHEQEEASTRVYSISHL